MTVAEYYLLKFAYEQGYSVEETLEFMISGYKESVPNDFDGNWVCKHNDVSPQNSL